MAGKRGTQNREPVVTPEPTATVIAEPEVTPMAEHTVAEPEVEESTSPVTVTTAVEPLDMLQDTCPSTELKARYTDEQRSALREMFDSGKLIRVLRAIEISAGKNATGQDQQGPYFAYVPVLKADANGLVDMSAAIALAGGKLAFHTDWEALGQTAENDAQKAQKVADETWGVASFFDHGFDLKVRQNVRAHYMDELQGPIAEIAKGVKQVFLTGVEDTKQAAFDLVIEKRLKRGMPVPEGLTLERLNITWPKGQ